VPWGDTFRAEAGSAFRGDHDPTISSTSCSTSCEIGKRGFLFEKEILSQDSAVVGKRATAAQAQTAYGRNTMIDSHYPKHLLGRRGHWGIRQRRCHFEIFPWPFFLSLLPPLICFPLLHHIFFRDMVEKKISELVRHEVTRQGGCSRLGSLSALKTAAQGQSEVPEEETKPAPWPLQSWIKMLTLPQVWGQSVL